MIYLVAPYSHQDFKYAAIEDVYNYCKNKSTLGVDIETSAKPGYEWYEKAGLDPYTSTVCMLQIGDLENQYVIDTRYVNPSILKPIIESEAIVKVGVNLKFEAKHFKQSFGWVMNNLQDCMLNEMVLNCGRKTKKGFYSMAGMAKRYLNYSFANPRQGSLFEETNIFKDIRKEFRLLKNKPFTPYQIHYGAGDVIIPLKILSHQIKLISRDNLELTAKLENDYCLVIADMELAGIPFDVDKWNENTARYTKYQGWVKKILDKFVENHHPEFIGINWNSSVQVCNLFEKLGIPILVLNKDKSTKTKKVYKRSVAEGHISKFKKKFKIVRAYLLYKKMTKSVTTYGDTFLTHVNPVTGRIHSNYFQILNTGRISSSSPNLQNIPAEEKAYGFRRCFSVPQGWSMIVADYSGQETRVLADFANEKNLIHFLLHGDGDLHSDTARRMFPDFISKKETPVLRAKAKNLNFSISYGGTEMTLWEKYQIPIKEGKKLIRTYYSIYPDLKSYFDTQQKLAWSRGYILIDPVTRRRSYNTDQELMDYCFNFIKRWKSMGWEHNIPAEIKRKYRLIKSGIGRNAQNYRIQGASGSMTKIAGVLMRKWIHEQRLTNKIQIVNMVHDEIVVACSEIFVNRVSDKLKWCMERAGQKFVKSVPMPATPVVSSWWTH